MRRVLSYDLITHLRLEQYRTKYTQYATLTSVKVNSPITNMRRKYIYPIQKSLVPDIISTNKCSDIVHSNQLSIKYFFIV